MTKKPKTSRNQNLMQRIYSCNDYVCMHKKEPEGFRKRRKSPNVLAENWCKNHFLYRFRSRQLLYHFLFICCDDVPSFFRKYNFIPCISKSVGVIPVIINLCFQFYDVFQKCTHLLIHSLVGIGLNH